MADPVALLREYTKSKKKIVLEGDQIRFDSISFPRNIETGFKVKEGGFYTLDALWFLLQNVNKKHSDYVLECSTNKFPVVNLIDKKTITEYLTGKSDARPVGSTVPSSVSSIPEERKRKEAPEDSFVSKKAKTEAETQLSDTQSTLGSEKVPELKRKRPHVTTTPSKYKVFESDPEMMKIVERERAPRDRVSILQNHRKPFNELIESFKKTLRKEEAIKKQEEQKHAAEQKKKANTYDRYGDVQEDKFWASRLKNATKEFEIDTRGTFANVGRIEDMAASVQKKPETAPQQVPKPKPEVKPPRPSTAPSVAQKKETPIIIVPSAITSMLTLFNVKEFLQDSTFISSVDKKNGGAKKENVIQITRKKLDGSSAVYQVIDNVSKMDPKDWNRVVAVFVIGQEWQFKNWRWSTPVDIFTRIPGFFLHWSGEKVPPIIKSWDVKVLSISKQKTKSHMCQTATMQFWDAIDHFCLTKKPNLEY